MNVVNNSNIIQAGGYGAPLPQSVGGRMYMYGQPQAGVAIPPGGYDYQPSQMAPGYGAPPPPQYPMAEYVPGGTSF